MKIRRLLVTSALMLGAAVAGAAPAQADDGRTACLSLEPTVGYCQGVPVGLLKLVGDLLP